MNWALAFALTCVIELPIVIAWARGRRRHRVAIDAFAANLFTHPAAWYLVRSLGTPWLAVEIGVTAVESLVYRRVSGFDWWRAIAASGCANGVTAALSFVF